MPATGLLALLDDVTAILDDVATLSKAAAQKTAGIAGDDLAVNAQGLVGIDPSRELPVVGKVALGSAVNKLVLIPLALALPKAVITPLLMLGGGFLCFEGLHKVLHRNDPDEERHREALKEALRDGQSLAELERQKVKQAIVTDIILSAEIVAVALGAVADQPLATRALVLSLVSFGMTAAIYGLVALIVKLDDIGVRLQAGRATGAGARFGRFLVAKTPVLMKGIAVGGTLAMFLVGGGIILHGIPGAEHALAALLAPLQAVPMLPSVLSALATLLTGLLVGAFAVPLVGGAGKLLARLRLRGGGR